MKFLNVLNNLNIEYLCNKIPKLKDFRMSYFFITVIIVFCLIKLWLVKGQCLWIIGNATYDDALFISWAKSMLTFNWLGPYNHLTLAKGPFYSMWIVTSFILGIPLLLSQHLLYIAAILTFILAIKPVINSQKVLLIIFIVLLFNPMTYSTEIMYRTIREGIYPALTLLVVSLSIGALLRYNKPLKNILYFNLCLGLSFSAFWLTREEGIWLLPFMILFSILNFLLLLKNSSKNWVKVLLVCISPYLVFACAIFSLSLVNYVKYKVFITVEFKEREFLNAYGALARVKSDNWKPQIPVPKNVREKIYKVSPAFTKLEPYLEGEIGKRWAKESNSNEIQGGWFLWALRESVENAGYYKDGITSAEFYQTVANEINKACDEKKLICASPRSSMMPPWNGNYNLHLFKSIIKGLFVLCSLEGFDPYNRQSVLPGATLNLIQLVTGERLNIYDQLILIVNTYSPDSLVNLSIRKSNDDTLVYYTLKRGSGGNVLYKNLLLEGKNISNAKESKYVITTDCLKGCYLEIETEKSIKKVALDNNIQSINTPNLYFEIVEKYTTKNILNNLKLKILDIIGHVYMFILPIIFLIGIVGYLFSTIKVFQTQKQLLNWVILTAIMATIFVRILILSLIDTTSFSAIIPIYLSPLYPLLFISVLLNLLMSLYWIGEID